jgi:hypothetical protein
MMMKTSTTKKNQYAFQDSVTGMLVRARGHSIDEAIRRSTMKLNHRRRKRGERVPRKYVLELRFVVAAAPGA